MAKNRAAHERSGVLGNWIARSRSLVPQWIPWLNLMVFPLILQACASGPVEYKQGFSCSAWRDGWVNTVTLLEFSYGDKVPNLHIKAPNDNGTGCGGAWLPMPNAEFLYVKWRIRDTGEIIEERVDLRRILPKDMSGHEVTFVIEGHQLYVFLVTPTKITQNPSLPPLKTSLSRYRVTYEIFPHNDLTKVR